MKVALVYDRVNKWGGAERILLALHELFPNAPLYTSVYNKKTAQWAKIFDVRSSFLQSAPFASSNHELYPLFMPVAFESFSFEEYDLVISVSSEAAKGIIVKPPTKHICYCLTPTRYLWSGYDEYFKNQLVKYIANPALSYLKQWDVVASKRPDKYIAISEEVRKRIEKYYHRNATVIYPPVELPSEKYAIKTNKSTAYFLVVSRLVPYKRVDVAIQACNELGLPLKIIGVGSEEQRLKALAGKTIEFLGNVSDDTLIGYYKNCQALLFPGLEDLGLTVIEAQGFGKPVIAYKGGGALETIQNGKTGVFFAPQTKTALKHVLKKFDASQFSPEEAIKYAQRFTKKQFQEQFTRAIGKFMKNIIQ